MLKFQEYLLSKKLICTIRESKGLDISAACGQLKEKEQSENSWCADVSSLALILAGGLLGFFISNN